MSSFKNNQPEKGLSAAEELKLVSQWQETKDQASIDKLVRAFTPFIQNHAKTAHKLHPHMPLQDCQQIAAEAFILALAPGRFDPSLGYRVSTYTDWSLKAALKDQAHKANMHRPINGGGSRRLNVALKHEMAKHPEWHTPLGTIFRNVGEKMNASPAVVENVYLRNRSFKSLDTPLHDEQDSISFGETLKDEEALNPAEKIDREKLMRFLKETLSALPERQQKILLDHYGLATDGEEVPLDEIGQREGVSRQRIHQIETKSFGIIKDLLEQNGYDRQTVRDILEPR